MENEDFKIEDLGVDQLGRRSIKVGTLHFTIQKPRLPFPTWADKTYRDGYRGFEKLDVKDKETVFLRWKHGFSEDRVNQELEASERAMIAQIGEYDLKDSDPGVRFHVQNLISFHRHCTELKKRYGISQLDPDDIPQEFETAKRVFLGR